MEDLKKASFWVQMIAFAIILTSIYYKDSGYKKDDVSAIRSQIDAIKVQIESIDRNFKASIIEQYTASTVEHEKFKEQITELNNRLFRVELKLGNTNDKSLRY